MPVEINYFAWENNKYQNDDYSSVYGFAKYLGCERMVSGHHVATVMHHKGLHPPIFYDFYAEHENNPIVMMTRLTAYYKSIYEWNEFAVDTTQAKQVRTYLSELPVPTNSSGDYFPPSPRNEHLGHLLRLGSDFNYVEYHWSTSDFLNMPDDNQWQNWFDLVEKIINICQEIAGDPFVVQDNMITSIYDFRDLFKHKFQHIKYQEKWSPLSELKKNSPKLTLYYQLKNVNLNVDLQTQRDFRHHLSWFLYMIAMPTYGNSIHIEPLIVFQKIGETDLSSWDDDEREALGNYLNNLWEYVLAYYPPFGIDAYTFIHGVQLTGAEVMPYINHWKQELHRVEVTRHLAGYVESLFEAYAEQDDHVFDDVPISVRRWLLQTAESDYFLKRFIEYDGVRPFAQEFADADAALNILREAGL